MKLLLLTLLLFNFFGQAFGETEEAYVDCFGDGNPQCSQYFNCDLKTPGTFSFIEKGNSSYIDSDGNKVKLWSKNCEFSSAYKESIYKKLNNLSPISGDFGMTQYSYNLSGLTNNITGNAQTEKVTKDQIECMIRNSINECDSNGSSDVDCPGKLYRKINGIYICDDKGKQRVAYKDDGTPVENDEDVASDYQNNYGDDLGELGQDGRDFKAREASASADLENLEASLGGPNNLGDVYSNFNAVSVNLLGKGSGGIEIKTDNSNNFDFCNQFWEGTNFLTKDSASILRDGPHNPQSIPNKLKNVNAFVEAEYGELEDPWNNCQADIDLFKKYKESNDTASKNLGQDPSQSATTASCKKFAALRRSKIVNDFNTSDYAVVPPAQKVAHCRSLRVVFAFNKFKPQYNGDTVKSIDGAYRCTIEGEDESNFAVDYRSCATLVNTYNAAFIAEQGMNTGILLTDASKQTKIMETVQQNEGNLQVNALEGQADFMKKKAGNEAVKEGFFATKGAAITAMLLTYVTPTNFPKKCARKLGAEFEPFCHFAVMKDSNNPSSMLFPNRDMKAAFVQAAAQAGVQAVAADISRRQYKKMEGQLRNAAGELDNTEYDNLGVQTGQDLIIHRCKLNPRLPECQNGGNLTYHDPYNNGGLFFEGGENNSFDLDTEGSEAIPLADNYESDTTSGLEDLNGAIVAGDGKSKPSGIAPAKSARITKSGSGMGQAGGGNSGASASAPGLGRAPAESSGASGLSNLSTGVRYGSRKVKYGSGGSGSYDGDSRKSKNPFDALGKGSKGGVEINRNLAAHDIVSAKAGSIFERISNRYAKVQSQNRVEIGTRQNSPEIKK